MGNTASHGLQDGVVTKKEMERMQRRCDPPQAMPCATLKACQSWLVPELPLVPPVHKSEHKPC